MLLSVAVAGYYRTAIWRPEVSAVCAVGEVGDAVTVVDLLQSEATDLGHALASHVASLAGVRLLAIKGPVANAYRLRPTRTSADVDLLVAPSDVPVFVDALARCGWTERPNSRLGSTLVAHSTTLVHDGWPCDIDVHNHFPGFLAPPGEVFEALWAERDSIALAGIEIPCVGRAGALLIAALHALRTLAQGDRMVDEYGYAVEAATALNQGEALGVLALALETGAVDTARPVLRSLCVELPGPTPAKVVPALDAWRSRVAARGTPGIQVANVFAASSWRARARLVALVVWPSARDLRLDHPEIGTSRSAAARVRVRRARNGVRTIRSVFRARRSANRSRYTDVDSEGRS